MCKIEGHIFNKYKLLLIDDDSNIIKVLRDILESAGYRVIATCFSEEGLKMARNEKPDLILLDIVMPGLDGYTFLKLLRLDGETKNIPVIILTAKYMMKELFVPEKIVDYIIKPFNHKELLEKIERYCIAKAI